ncbi:MAG TPA: hypothetical protein VNT03_08450 [Baekduia sp.]|nr:hypothetical protein [Baekduia sp.]
MIVDPLAASATAVSMSLKSSVRISLSTGSRPWAWRSRRPRLLGRQRPSRPRAGQLRRPSYPLALNGDRAGATGLGKPLKPILHPPRDRIPTFIAAEGPNNIASAFPDGARVSPIHFAIGPPRSRSEAGHQSGSCAAAVAPRKPDSYAPRADRMSLIAANRLLRRARRHLLVAAAVLVSAGAVAAHHGMPIDMHAMPAAAMCLAVLGGAAVAAGSALVLASRQALPRFSACWVPHQAPVGRPRSAPARAGPLFVCLQVLRR